jgi:hypothetical protein
MGSKMMCVKANAMFGPKGTVSPAADGTKVREVSAAAGGA